MLLIHISRGFIALLHSDAHGGDGTQELLQYRPGWAELLFELLEQFCYVSFMALRLHELVAVPSQRIAQPCGIVSQYIRRGAVPRDVTIMKGGRQRHM